MVRKRPAAASPAATRSRCASESIQAAGTIRELYSLLFSFVGLDDSLPQASGSGDAHGGAKNNSSEAKRQRRLPETFKAWTLRDRVG